MWFVRKMRHLPELRSRTNNEQRVVTDSPKILTNGLSSRTRNHVRTRSQAKAPVGLRKKASPNAKSPQPKTASLNHVQRSKANLSRYSNRLNGIPRKRTSANTLGSPKWKNAKRGPGRPPGSRTGVRKPRTTSAAVKFAGEERRRLIKQRLRRREKLREGKSEKDKLANQRAIAAERRTDRLNKRRSALWVLNCEAESFLFGETAADKHEVELPPLSSPPKKRRRIRANELGTLLKETPLLSTKLRAPVKTPPKDEDTNSTTSCGHKFSRGKREKEDARNALSKPPKLVPSSSQSDLDKNLDLLNNTDDDDDILPPYLSREPVTYELSPIASPLSMYSNFSGENSMQNFPDKSSKYKSARIDTIVTSMEWKYSFEELPTDEVWYSTFKRQEEHSESPSDQSQPSVCCSKNHSFTPLVLPYETRLLANRSPFKRKGGRLPRKSPRCHASTLAILSSLKRGRGRGALVSPVPPASTPGSQTATASVDAQSKVESIPLPPPEPIPVETPPPPPKIRKIPKKKELHATSLTLLEPPTIICPRPSALPPVSPPLLSPVSSPGNPSPSSSTSFSSRLRNREMSATQYLWDSIQLLSDPYVIQVLAGEEEKTPSPKLSKPSQNSRKDINQKNGVRGLTNGTAPRSAATNPSKTKGPRNITSANSRGFSLSGSKSTGGTNGKCVMSEVKDKFCEASKFVVKTCRKASTSNKCNITSEKPVSDKRIVDSVRALKFNEGGTNGKSVATVTLSSARLTKSRLHSGDSGESESEHPKNGRQNNNNVKLKLTNCTVNGHSFHRKSPRKSPVVLVSDIFKSGSSKLAFLNSQRSCNPFENGSNNINSMCNSSVPSDIHELSYSHNISNFEVSRFMPSEISNDGKIGKDEDLLFLLEGIPPLPAWPV